MTPRQRIVVVTAAVGLLLAIVIAIGFTQMLRSPTARTVSVAPASTRAAKPNAGTPAWPGFTFEDGTFWQITGLREYPDGTQWWGGNGATVKEPQAPSFRTAATNPSTRLIEFRFRATSIEDAYKRRFRFAVPSKPFITSITQAQSHVILNGSAIFPVPRDQQTTDLRVGLPAAPPVDLLHADLDFTAGALRATTRSVTPPTTLPSNAAFGAITYESGHLAVEIKIQLNAEWRLAESTQRGSEVTLINKAGRPMRYTSVVYGNNQLTYDFVIGKEQIAAVVFQTRDIEWLTLPSIPLRPKATTTSPAR